ncbi:hypothetical protein O1R50_12870 [Glycomyces luteolus]|uniref:Uncharacterized protein n=2 Tax=Glycomyces luteolus TaxID=2670330 RepID=A0A9X3SQH5_9ACTN|nr:hypothetical protein [Glycomyces luteolus]
MNLNTETFGPIRRLLAVGGIALAGSVALSGCGILEDAASDSATDNEVSDEQVDAVADAKVGDCLPEEMISADPSVFAVDCSDPTAFWTITAFEADPGLTAASDGSSLTDPQPIFDMCGEEVGAQIPGATWTDWSMVYDQTTLEVNYIFCVEANGNPSTEGVTPTVPANEGECTLTATTQWNYGTIDCAAGDAAITSVIEVPQAEWETVDVDALATEECTGSSYFGAEDQFARTAAVFCLE